MSNWTRHRSDPPARSSRATVFALLAAAGVVAVDQASKWLVRQAAGDLPYELGWGFGLREVANTGVSFGRFSGSNDVILVAVTALAAMLGIATVVSPPRYRFGFGVLLGGAIGNLIDRMRFGAVIDFVDVPWWPTFNVADVAIIGGVLVIVWQVLNAPRA